MADNLFGKPGDEYMYDDVATVYENWMDDRFEDDYYPAEGFVIEEWTAKPLGDFIDETWRVLERIHENLCDEFGNDDAHDALERATEHPEVVGAYEAARAVLASKLTGWRQADKRIAEHRITWGSEHEPLVDGLPLYRTSEPT